MKALVTESECTGSRTSTPKHATRRSASTVSWAGMMQLCRPPQRHAFHVAAVPSCPTSWPDTTNQCARGGNRAKCEVDRTCVLIVADCARLREDADIGSGMRSEQGDCRGTRWHLCVASALPASPGFGTRRCQIGIFYPPSSTERVKTRGRRGFLAKWHILPSGKWCADRAGWSAHSLRRVTLDQCVGGPPP